MAAYTPVALATAVALTATGGTQIIAAFTTNVLRTIHFSTSAAGKAVTFSQGADAAGTRLFDAMPLTQNVPSIFNGWWVGTARWDGNVNSTTAQISVSGYQYA